MRVNDLPNSLFRLLCLSLRNIIFLSLLVSAPARADVHVKVTETAPASPATLGHWEQFYLRIAYEADRPIRIRAEGYAGDKPLASMNSGSPRYEAGKGEAMFWIAYTRPARVDRIVVTAEDDKTGKPVAQVDGSVDLTWTGQPVVNARPKPDWVTRLQADRDRRHSAEMKEYAERPTPWWTTLLVYAAVWSVPFYFIAQIVMLARWRGGWRIAAAVPAVPMLFVVGHAIFAFAAGSNIFPIVLIFTSPPALVYLGIVFALRYFRRQAG